MDVPTAPSVIQIESIKHDGSLHRRWENNTVLDVKAGRVMGINYRTLVTEGSGTSFRTDTPALFYFKLKSWFNIVYVMNEHAPYYYCNISSPYLFHEQKLQYIDYDIDLIVYPDFTYQMMDETEYEENKERYGYPERVDIHVRAAVRQLEKKIHQREAPFHTAFIDNWRKKIYLWLSKRT